MTDEELLKEFNKHASSASFHYADDTGKEWGLAHKAEDKALKIFDDNPHLQATIRSSFNELWSLEKVRPKTDANGGGK